MLIATRPKRRFSIQPPRVRQGLEGLHAILLSLGNPQFRALIRVQTVEMREHPGNFTRRIWSKSHACELGPYTGEGQICCRQLPAERLDETDVSLAIECLLSAVTPELASGNPYFGAHTDALTRAIGHHAKHIELLVVILEILVGTQVVRNLEITHLYALQELVEQVSTD